MDHLNNTLGNGYNVLPVKFNEASKAVHYFYYKAHKVRDPHPDKPNKKTLFLLNVPPYCNEECLKRLFANCGTIERVFFHQKPTSDVPPPTESTHFPAAKPITGYRFAYLVFGKPSQLKKALQMVVKEPLILFTDENPPLVGINKWRQEYNQSFLDTKAVQEEINNFMADYDTRTEEEVKNEKELEGVPDEDGWITVTKHGKKPALSRTETYDRRIAAKERKKRTRKELLNFYTFQIRESKMEHIAQLRKKFEEDKQRIALLKASRKFRPF